MNSLALCLVGQDRHSWLKGPETTSKSELILQVHRHRISLKAKAGLGAEGSEEKDFAQEVLFIFRCLLRTWITVVLTLTELRVLASELLVFRGTAVN